MKKHIIAAVAGVSSALLSAQVFAASHLPTGALAGMVTDATDTFTDATGPLIALGIAGALFWFVVSLPRRGSRKAGL